jgi:hypothetical protein
VDICTNSRDAKLILDSIFSSLNLNIENNNLKCSEKLRNLKDLEKVCIEN